ncbi:amidohydrolase family protein [Streptacidiphilus anmyonensis]|uniref:amidohydrolase family protein n=1 Tax=Streptacidiphilus anmyonensis TaxID=405782 RepID=UPI000A005257|nr:amidohydrolase family protein [Streptacidiphilus anmyonensis]
MGEPTVAADPPVSPTPGAPVPAEGAGQRASSGVAGGAESNGAESGGARSGAAAVPHRDRPELPGLPGQPRLVDQHCHSVVGSELAAGRFASLLTESDRPPALGASPWDSAVGLAVRRWCAPELGLPPFAPAEAYLERRRELGVAEATRVLLRAAGLGACLVDTGLTQAAGVPLLSPEELGGVAQADVHEVVRIEYVAEQAVSPGTGAHEWAAIVGDALRSAAARAVGLKSVVAYRCGLDFEPRRPAPAEVANAAALHLASGSDRLAHPVLLRHLLWEALELGLPLQLHTGFGDPDLVLHRSDPSLLTGFIRAAEPYGTPLVLLHGWPYHRQAAWLAQAFPHVYCDLGLTLTHVGAGARRVLAETLELAPFHKLLFSTDAYGLPELYLVGVAAFADALDAWLGEAVPAEAEAARIAALVAGGNARRLYRLP